MNAIHRIGISMVVFALAPGLMGMKGEGCAQKFEEAAARVPDVRGNYAITHGDNLSVTISAGGVISNGEGPHGGVITAGDHTLELSKLCELPGVHCPSEAFWDDVAINQPFFDTTEPHNPWLLQVVNVSDDKGVYAMERGGIVGEDGKMVLVLGLGGVAAGTCGLVGGSIATGEFEKDALDQATGKITGEVVVVYAGGCLFPGEEALAGASITLKSQWTGVRTGNFNVPSGIDAPVLNEEGEELDAQGEIVE